MTQSPLFARTPIGRTLIGRPSPVGPKIPPIRSSRVPSIDVLRGFVMVVMALDHTRDFFTNQSISLADPSHLSLPYFFTRWITHVCAPAFVFLAGLSASLQLSGGKSKGRLSAFLVSRGAWLVVLQFTVIYVVMIGPPGPGIFQVIGALGLSMIVLGLVLWFPIAAIAAMGLAIVAGHNAFDAVHADRLAHLSALWRIAHERGMIRFHRQPILSVVYPFVPWSGLMMLGYAFGAMWKQPSERVRSTAILGAGSLVLFLLLRSLHAYGDPHAWANYGLSTLTVTTFLNVEKYPPSLQFIAVTMGIALLLLACFDWLLTRGRAAWLRGTFEVYGRVPLAFYIVHFGLIHLLAITICFATGYDWRRFATPLPYGSFIAGTPHGYGFSLPGVYFIWSMIVIALYRPMHWYADYKRGHPEKRWLSYL